MRTRVAVIGGGITGQMVQWAVPTATVYDWKRGPVPTMTRNYGGNYLWAPIEAPGVRCRKFLVRTHVDGAPATREAILRYKYKIGKSLESSDNWYQQFQEEMSGWDFTAIPPPRIEYNHRIVEIRAGYREIQFADSHVVEYDVLVSTIPLYSLMSLLGWQEPHGGLLFRPIYVKRTARPADAPYGQNDFYINYLSSKELPIYRYTDRDGERHFESLSPVEGFAQKLTPGKIYDEPRTVGILQAMAGFDICPMGRYGRWSSNELVHETWSDILAWRDVYNLR